MPRAQTEVLDLAVMHPLAQASRRCQGLLAVFGIVEQLPAIRRHRKSGLAPWQWGQENPNWGEYILGEPAVAKQVVISAVIDTRSALEDVRHWIMGRIGRQ